MTDIVTMVADWNKTDKVTKVTVAKVTHPASFEVNDSANPTTDVSVCCKVLLLCVSSFNHASIANCDDV